PARLEVADEALGAQLAAALADPELAVTVRDGLPAVHQMVRQMAAQLEDAPPPDALDAPGVTVERMRAFAAAARDFYQAAPWRYLSDADLIHVEAPAVAPGLAHATVLGAGGRTFGLGFYASPKEFEAAHAAPATPRPAGPPCHGAPDARGRALRPGLDVRVPGRGQRGPPATVLGADRRHPLHGRHAAGESAGPDLHGVRGAGPPPSPARPPGARAVRQLRRRLRRARRGEPLSGRGPRALRKGCSGRRARAGAAGVRGGGGPLLGDRHDAAVHARAVRPRPVPGGPRPARRGNRALSRAAPAQPRRQPGGPLRAPRRA